MSVGQQFSDFRKTTPRYVQWVLLFAALLVVLVLLILLRGSKKTPKIAVGNNGPLPITPELRVTPNTPIDWSNTFVGEERSEEIKISANQRGQVTNVTLHVDGDTSAASGISATNTCENDETIIGPDMACIITITFRPTNAMENTGVNVSIHWNVIDYNIPMDAQNAITAIIGAREKPVMKQEQRVLPESDEEYDNFNADDDSFYYDDDFDTQDSFKKDLDDIAPEMDFYQPEPINDYVTNPRDVRQNGFGNACSDFAFPAYNTAGIQSGWIKPEAGAYYYHPFSDTNCDTPTGIYNAETGYIMDIMNPSHRIGSDSEHIRLSITERVPVLSGGSSRRSVIKATQLSDADLGIMPTAPGTAASLKGTPAHHIKLKEKQTDNFFKGYENGGTIYSSAPYDRTFVLRQYKPIPATIVSDIQADAKMLQGGLPVRATVDRNVYSDNGRTVIIPTGTLMLGRVIGELPGPYKAVGRMQIEWYQFIRPDGVEFNFTGEKPFSADSQGRKGVPGHGNTDYLQQFVMPMLTALVPAAVNLIAPISDAFVNQIDLDNNTVVQTGTVRSSELAKNEIITAWNNVATKLLVDMMDNTTPPFSIAAGTRITVFSPVDLVVTCGDPKTDSRKCAIRAYTEQKRGSVEQDSLKMTTNTEELIGQVRSMLVENIRDFCSPITDNNKQPTGAYMADYKQKTEMEKRGYNFNTVDFYCRSLGTYDAINNAKQTAVFQNQQQTAIQKTDYSTGQNTVQYNQQVLGLEYNADGTIKNPFNNNSSKTTPAPSASTSVVTCDGGANPDVNGCCPGETYTDMGDQGFNCCPDAGGDCFPPIQF